MTETFEERAGKTFFTAILSFPSVADRDGYLSTGAREGGEASLDRLASILEQLLEESRS